LSRNLAPAVYAEVLVGYRKGFRLVFIILAGLAVFSFVTAFFLMPHRDLDRPDDKKLREEGKEFVAKLKEKNLKASQDLPEKRAAKEQPDLEPLEV
jgi:phosphotransferase system  glucose/maltose/N-acetylglucosamine-specific IIC component